MVTIEFSPQEKQSGTPLPANLESAALALEEDGFVLLSQVVALDHIAILRERMLGDVEAALARPDAPFNFNTGNLQQDPPPFHPFLFRDVLLNDLVIAISRRVLGPRPKNAFYSGNTALPGCTRQPVHPDVSQLWPDLRHPTPAFGLVVNVPVVDMDARNGSTELWPGSHHDTAYSIHDGSARISEPNLERRSETHPPLQPTAKAGDILMRDIRLWHAGMPNQTQQPRPMIAMIHWCSWWSAHEKIRFPREAQSWLAHAEMETQAEWVDGEVKYLQHNQSYDLQK